MAAGCHENRAEEFRRVKVDAMKNILKSPYARRNRSFLISVVITLAVATPSLAQNSPNQLGGIPEDWTHHRTVFGDAGTAEQAMQGGKYERWLKTVYDPRYQLQRAKRIAAARANTVS